MTVAVAQEAAQEAAQAVALVELVLGVISLTVDQVMTAIYVKS